MRKSVRIVSEAEFDIKLRYILSCHDLEDIGAVTGPGRSGAVAAVYTSHLIGVPFIPYGSQCPEKFRLLIIDTARQSGATMRKAERRYSYANPLSLVCFEEPPRVAFWYEARKPQRFRHERKIAA